MYIIVYQIGYNFGLSFVLQRANLTLFSVSFSLLKCGKSSYVHHNLYSLLDWIQVWTELCSKNAERANLSL